MKPKDLARRFGLLRGDPKETKAAKFFHNTFADMSQAEITDCVAALWKNYRRWQELCRLMGVDPDNSELFIIDIGGGLTTVNQLFRTMKSWVLDPCTDELYRLGIDTPSGVHYINGQAERVPFPGGLFDVVFCTNALDHFVEPAAALREMRRILKSAGYCVIAVDVFPESRLSEDRGIKHPHTLTEEGALELLQSEFDFVAHWHQPQGGKVGFKSLVRGDLVPASDKEELICLLRAKPNTN